MPGLCGAIPSVRGSTMRRTMTPTAAYLWNWCRAKRGCSRACLEEAMSIRVRSGTSPQGTRLLLEFGLESCFDVVDMLFIPFLEIVACNLSCQSIRGHSFVFHVCL